MKIRSRLAIAALRAARRRRPGDGSEARLRGGQLVGFLQRRTPTVGRRRVRTGASAATGRPPGTLRGPQLPRQGPGPRSSTVTSKWMVVQTHERASNSRSPPTGFASSSSDGPRTPDQLTPNSLVEVTGVNAGSENVVIADHLDIYEADAQRLVTPTVHEPLLRQQPDPRLRTRQKDHDQFSSTILRRDEEYGIPNRMHIVGNPPFQARPLRLRRQRDQLDGDPVRRERDDRHPGHARLERLRPSKGDVAYIVADGTGSAKPQRRHDGALQDSLPLRQFSN